jgi:hypothetical protein
MFLAWIMCIRWFVCWKSCVCFGTFSTDGCSGDTLAFLPGRSADEVGLLFLAAGVDLAFVIILSEPGTCGGSFSGCSMGG